MVGFSSSFSHCAYRLAETPTFAAIESVVCLDLRLAHSRNFELILIYVLGICYFLVLYAASKYRWNLQDITFILVRNLSRKTDQFAHSSPANGCELSGRGSFPHKAIQALPAPLSPVFSPHSRSALQRVVSWPRSLPRPLRASMETRASPNGSLL